MKEIYDQQQIDSWLCSENILSHFDTKNLVFRAYRYEKGEFITSPTKELHDILFLVEGTIQIYGIRDNGSISPINEAQKPAVLGDLEFCTYGFSAFYTQAKTSVVFLSLSTKRYRDQLDRDLKFLHMLLHSYADKLCLGALVNLTAPTIEERVLLYMRNFCPSSEIKGIEATVHRLRCSRRQLQRVLKKLCETGKIEKIGKGQYRLM